MPSSSRIVFAEDLVGAAPWQPGALVRHADVRNDGLSTSQRRRSDLRAAESPTYEDGMRDGLAQGIAQGLARAKRDFAEDERARREAFAHRADGLVVALTVQLAALQQTAADEVTALAVEIARSALGGALRVQTERVVPVVAEALAAIADEHGRPVVRLHPDDIALAGEPLAALLAAHGAQLAPDPALTPGGCLVETARAGVDATLQTRWRRALAALGVDGEWVEP
jgi:flagellar assembly protein FliH